MTTVINFNDINDFSFHDSVCTIGVFDGLHLGHQKIIEKVIEVSREKKSRSVILTFENHPQSITRGKAPRFIIDPREKISCIERKFAPDFIITIWFDTAWAEMGPYEFLTNILLKKLCMKFLIVGHDFRFGKKGSGNLKFLKKHASVLNYSIEVIPPVFFNKHIISSTRIRQLITEKDFMSASNFLGRKYTITGKIIPGRQLGTKIGFPTINIEVPSHLHLPEYGVYLVEEESGHFGVANLGVRPTFDFQDPVLEIHFFTLPDRGLTKLNIAPLQFIRQEKKFKDVTELVCQIKKDVETAKELLKNYLHFKQVMLK